MAPDLERVLEERPAHAPPLVVIATGDPQHNREQALPARVLLDPAFAVGGSLGVGGTPMAVRTTSEGTVGSGLASGAADVLDLLRA
jgi:hypothetical protein